ncbi:hypothetical protein Q5P01_000313 [Channa striata]|uniref:Uncharacterized protein n=1 Tax=Channa striata TaxID=64152 RepID=A0AA88LEX1_CHASR|nr:hypothetical protein Q5P01_000313 [Channa striata]
MFAPLSCAPGPLFLQSSPTARPAPADDGELRFLESGFYSRVRVVRNGAGMVERGASSTGRRAPEPLHCAESDQPGTNVGGAPRSASQARVGPLVRLRDKYIFYVRCLKTGKSELTEDEVSYLFEDEAARCARSLNPEWASRYAAQVQGCVRCRSRSGSAPPDLSRFESAFYRARTERARSPRWTATPSARIERRADPLPPQTDRRLSHRSETGPCSQTPPSGYAETRRCRALVLSRLSDEWGRGFRLRGTPTRARFRRGEERHPRRRRSSTRLHRDGLSSTSARFVEDRHAPGARGEEEDGAEARGKRGEARGRDASDGARTEWFPADTLRSESSGDGSAAAGVSVEPPRRVHARGLWRGRSTAECPRCTHRSPEYHAEAAPEGLRTNKHIFDRSGVFAPRTMDGLRSRAELAACVVVMYAEVFSSLAGVDNRRRNAAGLSLTATWVRERLARQS